MSVPVLSIERLRVSFETARGRIVGVDDVSLAVMPGQTVALVGESGSGKSATALSVLRLQPTPPARIERGVIRYEPHGASSIDLLSADARTLRAVRGAGVAMIFQEPMTAMNPVVTVGAQIVEAVRLHSACSKRSAREAATNALREVRLPDPARALSSYPHELSGGMRQRAMIAMALSCDPRVLLADEPTTALDATVQLAILELLRERQRARGMGMLLITHALTVARAVADVIAVMYAGRIVERAPALSVLDAPRHPYTRALLSCAPSVHHRPERLTTVADVLADGGARTAVPGGPRGARPWWPAPDGSRPGARLVEVAPGHHVLLARDDLESAPAP